MLEKFRWYCENCNAIVHEVELQVTDIVADLPPVFKAFYESMRPAPAQNAAPSIAVKADDS